MAGESLRHRLGEIGIRVHRWSQGTWSEEPTRRGIAYRRARPVRFPDMDAFTGFCESFDGYRGGTFVSVTWLNSNAVVGPPFAKVATRIAHAASLDRSRIEVRGSRAATDGRDTWKIYFDSRRRTARTIVVIEEDSGSIGRLPDKIQESIERFTVPMSRRDLRKSRPLLDPISLDDAVQREHDKQISASAARIGLLGAVGGAVLGAIFGALISWLVTSSPDSINEPTPATSTTESSRSSWWGSPGPDSVDALRNCL